MAYSSRLADLDEVRKKVRAHLEGEHAATILDLFFTTDEEWGKPAGE
jgi:predicted Co/Zn/Cd cation transporter (cation efflux family)